MSCCLQFGLTHKLLILFNAPDHCTNVVRALL